VRGGDYLEQGLFEEFGSVCDVSYYRSAIELIERKIENPRFFIFTNDRKHAERVLPEKVLTEALIVSDDWYVADPGYDLFLMSECTHFIIANSTYSWWGARLGNKPGKIVIVPAKWNGEICPPDWIRV